MNRRSFCLGTAAAALCAAPARTAFAQAPALDSIKLLVPAAPGGGWDGTARAMEKVLKEIGAVRTAQIEHQPGAGGTVALPKFLNAKGEKNLLMVSGLTIVTAAIANKTAYSITQTTPVARLTGEAHVLAVPAQSPFRTLQDFAAALKKDPGAVAVTGGTAGGTDHLTLGLMAEALGADARKLNWVPYNSGGQAQAAILGNHVQAGISNWSEFSDQLKAGRMRALGVSAEQRIPGVDVPTMREQGVDAVLFNWRGVFAPPGIAEAHRKELEQLVARMTASPAWKTEVERRSWVELNMTSEAFTPWLATEAQRIETIMRKLGFAA